MSISCDPAHFPLEARQNIRNVAVIGHSHHGKTVLMDSILSNTGVVSLQKIGEVRYMDSRPDEQKRGMTIKASSTSLTYTPATAEGAAGPGPFLFNILDSPGHVDFSLEATSALRLVDGCIVVVDAVEGVTAHTTALVRAALAERVRRCSSSASWTACSWAAAAATRRTGPRSCTRAKMLVDDFHFDPTDAKKLWCFAPDIAGPNMVVEQTKGVQYLNEIHDSVVAGFQMSCREGILCDEPLRGVRFNVLDVTLHSDSVHRGGGQIIQCARRVFAAAQYTAQPRLVEPVYLVTIDSPEEYLGGVYSVISNRRGNVIEDEVAASRGGGNHRILAHLPIVEAFGFSADLRAHTGGAGSAVLRFDHWSTMPGDPTDESSKARQLMEGVRARKGLAPGLPPLDRFLDKLQKGP